MTAGLFTDMYELTMLDAWIKEGRQDDPATFEVFARRLPPGHRYGVVAGTERVIDAIRNFRFVPSIHKEFLKGLGLSDETLDFLWRYEFKGELWGYAEGDLYFPNSPVLQVRGRLADVILETVILSVYNHDCAIASKAARIVAEAKGRPIIEMGSRRTHEEAAVASARAAYVAGFAATSNLAAGLRYDVPVRGTAAHAFTLSHKKLGNGHTWRDEPISDEHAELRAFEAQVAAMGPGTTLLVDTYNVEQGVRNAVKAAGTGLGAVRIDSGDLAANARLARELLNELGAFATKIVATSDLDEHVIKDLRIAEAPIDSYGVGTKLVSAEPAGMVYKLVDINGAPVEKHAVDKISIGGRKFAYRTYDRDGKVAGEYLYKTEPSVPHNDLMPKHARPLLTPLIGPEAPDPALGTEEARAFHAHAVDELPVNERAVWHGDHGPFIVAQLR